MVATAATSAFFPLASLTPDPNTKASKLLGGGSANLTGIKSKSVSSVSLQMKANAQASTTTAAPLGNVKIEDDIVSLHSRTLINQLPDLSMVLAAITTMFTAAEKQRMVIVEDDLVFRQNFPIRSYEIGADGLASIETLMNHLQETALSHCKDVGLLDDGFGSTPEMAKRNLIWVVTKMQVLIDRYPKWGDIVQVDSWVGAAGKNGMSRDWIVRDSKTGEILARASSVWVMMNKETRRLSKIPDAVRAEIEPCFIDTARVVEEDSRKLTKLNNDTADYIVEGLSPRWADLDMNQHVNNVKYISWILESAPLAILETHELSSMTLEYRRECGKDSVLQSLSAVSGSNNTNFLDSGNIECQHMLRLEEGAEVMRGRTLWKPKRSNSF